MAHDLAKCVFSIDHFADCTSLRYSSFFSPPNNSAVQFELFLNPSQAVPLCDDTFTFIFLYLHKSDVEELPVRYSISVINSAGEQVNTQGKLVLSLLQNSKTPKLNSIFFPSSTEGRVCYRFKSKGRYNGLYHISRATLLDRSNNLLQENGSIKVVCEVEVLQSGDQVDGDLSVSSTRKHGRKLGDSILEDYQTLLDSGDYSDVSLVLKNGPGDDDQRVVPAHKAVLSARSAYFADAFRENPHLGELTLKLPEVQNSLNSEVLTDLLRYIYTGRLQSLDRYAVELLEAAVHLRIPSLVALCEQSLAVNLSTDSVASVLLLADKHQAVTLKGKCIEYIIDMAEIVTLTDGWKELTATAHSELAFELFRSVIGKLHK